VADGVFGVEVVTPEEALLAGGASAVVLTTSGGDMTVLDGHISLIADVVPCLIKVAQPDGAEARLAVHGGFLQVETSPGAAEGLTEGDGPLPGMSTRVTVLAGVAEMAEEIDVQRAEQAKEAATQLVADLRAGRAPVSDDENGGDAPELALQEAEKALARAELRLAVAAEAG
jgi:F-type H+-transporting ATPase subunit epsilon